MINEIERSATGDIMSAMNVTPLETAMIVKIARSEYNRTNGHPKDDSDTETWIDMVVDSPEDKGVLSSLIKKGLVVSCVFEKSPSDNVCWLTTEGFAIYKEATK